MKVLEAEGISKSYGPTRVLEGVSLEIEHGEVVAIVGYSGSGKSTLLGILAGLVRPDSGEVRMHGRSVKGPQRSRGVVFQSYALLPWLSVEDNVRLAAEHEDKVDEYLELVGLLPARKKKPAQLSGGMKQRVALARALAMEPEVLLLDEPLSALDAITRGSLRRELARIARDRTVVLVTNDIAEAVEIAARVIPLSRGPGATLGPAVATGGDEPKRRIIEYLKAS